MLSFQESCALARDPAFLARLEAAAVKTAVAVCNEADSTGGHAARIGFARRVLSASRPQAESLALGAVVCAGLSAASTDAAIESALSAVWNAYAGA